MVLGVDLIEIDLCFFVGLGFITLIFQYHDKGILTDFPNGPLPCLKNGELRLRNERGLPTRYRGGRKHLGLWFLLGRRQCLRPGGLLSRKWL